MMLMKVVWLDALRGLKTQPLRSLLSIVAIAVAFMAFFCLLHLEQAADREIDKTLEAVRPNTMSAWVIQPPKSPNKITVAKWRLLSQVNHDLKIFPYHYLREYVEGSNQTNPIFYVATDLSLLSFLKLGIEKGVGLPVSAEQKGITVGSKLKSHGAAWLDTLWIKGEGYQVTNILKSATVNPLIQFDINESLFLPLLEVESKIESLDEFLIFYPDYMSKDEVKATFENLMRIFFQPYSIQFRDDTYLTEALKKSVEVFSTVLNYVAWLALATSLLGVLSQQWMAFLERRGECGMRLSLGASKGEILSLFLVESSILGILGAGIGLLAGLFCLKWLYGTLDWMWYASIKLSLQLLFGSTVLAMISGAIPAIIAGNSKPNWLLSYQSA